MKLQTRSRLAVLTAAVVTMLTLLVAGCGAASSLLSSSTPSASVTPTVTAPSAGSSLLCADVAALRASLSKLGHISVSPNAAAQLSANLTAVQSSLNTLANDASGQWQAQTTALKTAVANLKAQAKKLQANPSVSGVAAVTGALGQVTSLSQSLLAAAKNRCPAA